MKIEKRNRRRKINNEESESQYEKINIEAINENGINESHRNEEKTSGIKLK